MENKQAQLIFQVSDEELFHIKLDNLLFLVESVYKKLLPKPIKEDKILFYEINKSRLLKLLIRPEMSKFDREFILYHIKDNEKIIRSLKRKYKTNDLEKIKEEIKIKEYAEYNYGIKLINTGNKRYKCICPIHNEKTPSLVIYEESNSFYCFGCGIGGSIIDFVSKIDNLSIAETVKKLCR